MYFTSKQMRGRESSVRSTDQCKTGREGERDRQYKSQREDAVKRRQAIKQNKKVRDNVQGISRALSDVDGGMMDRR